jgi:hexosaminidase
MMRILTTLLLAWSLGPAAWAKGENPEPAVVPAVQRWAGGRGTFDAGAAPIVLDTAQAAALLPAGQALADDLAAQGLRPRALVKGTVDTPGGIVLTLQDCDPMLGPEGYRLEIGPRQTVLRANTARGAFYGTRTVCQILAARGDGRLPCGRIEDFPNYRHRMLMLDVARAPFPVPVLLDWLRIMAWYKMNELHLHLSDQAGRGDGYPSFRLKLAAFPGLENQDFSYSKAELRLLQDVAKTQGITITPEIDMPGHALAFTRYWPELKRTDIPASFLDVANAKSAERMKAVLDEAIPLFDAPDFHIGTDEYRIRQLPEPLRTELGEGFRQFINTMNRAVRAKGKTTRIWSGFENMPGTTLPDPDVVIDMWETDDAIPHLQRGHSVINSNHGRTYVVPGARYYNDCVQNPGGVYQTWEPWAINEKPERSPRPDDPKLYGGKLHVWNDLGPTGYTMTEIARLTHPSLVAFAEKMWGRKGSADYASFLARAEKVSRIPRVTLFDRRPSHSAGIVLDLREEVTLADARARVELLTGRAELEAPWTLTLQVRKEALSRGRGVILASPLAEICDNYSQVKEDTQKDPATGKTVTTRKTLKGLGVVRAAGAPGRDAASADEAEELSSVYGEPLPLGTWVTLAIVGRPGATRVYLDGKLLGQQETQTLCPLAGLGSTTPEHTFVGRIRNLLVLDRALDEGELKQLAASRP